MAQFILSVYIPLCFSRYPIQESNSKPAVGSTEGMLLRKYLYILYAHINVISASDLTVALLGLFTQLFAKPVFDADDFIQANLTENKSIQLSAIMQV